MQNETFSPQANEIPNNAASWLPGDDYYTNFHEGDPFIKVPEGYARLPGAGYEALHPELEGVDPEDYPDIHKMAILADVAPYSREYRPGVFILPGTKNLARARQAEAQLWNLVFSSTGLSPPSRVKGQACGLSVPRHHPGCASSWLSPPHQQILLIDEGNKDQALERFFFWAFRGIDSLALAGSLSGAAGPRRRPPGRSGS